VLPAEHRLTDAATFRVATRRGRRCSTRELSLHLVDAGPPAGRPVRVGFVVSKAVGGSVVRNRVRRRLRHVLRSHLGELSQGQVVVVRAFPAAAAATSAELDAAVTHCLRRCTAA
jgi:ribonuclease P protein component